MLNLLVLSREEGIQSLHNPYRICSRIPYSAPESKSWGSAAKRPRLPDPKSCPRVSGLGCRASGLRASGLRASGLGASGLQGLGL